MHWFLTEKLLQSRLHQYLLHLIELRNPNVDVSPPISTPNKSQAWIDLNVTKLNKIIRIKIFNFFIFINKISFFIK